MIFQIFGLGFKWLLNRESKRDEAEKQIIKLSHKMDALQKAQASMKIEYEKLESKLRDKERSALEAKQ